jgi:hypothetical protein
MRLEAMQGGMTNGTGTTATFYEPFGITVDAQGNFYIADTELGLIRKMTSSFVVSTLAGQGTSGYSDGTGSLAAFELPYGIVADGNGNLYITDTYNAVIRKVTPTGVVTTLAGNIAGGGNNTYVDGTARQQLLNSPGELPWMQTEIYLLLTGMRSVKSLRAVWSPHLQEAQ